MKTVPGAGDEMTNQSLTRTLQGQSAAGFAMRIGSAGVGFLFTTVVAINLGPAGFGTFAWIMAATSLLASIANFGWPALILRETAGNTDIPDPAVLGGLFGTGVIVSLLFSMIIVSSIFISHEIIGQIFPIISNIGMLTFACATALIPLQAIAPVRAGFLRGQHRSVLADIPELVVRPLVSLFLVMALLAGLATMSLGNLVVVQLLAFSVAALASIPLVTSIWKYNRRIIWPGSWIRSAATFWLIGPIGLLLTQSPLYLLGTLSTVAEVGQFAFAMQFASILSLVIISIELPIQSRIAAAYMRNNLQEVEAVTRSTGKALIYLSAAIGSVVILSLALMIGILGTEWAQALPVLGILAFGYLAYAGCGPARVSLSMTGNESIVLLVLSVTTIMALLIGFMIVPKFGSIGAATVLAAANALSNLAFYLICRCRLKISTSPLIAAIQ